ncbi:MAG TPA: TRAP transporter substrate-binding protein [Chloroflexota bacterium]|jgi:TRAP-type C4-dicarboxylate transport system substrate-binding protein
MQLAKRLSAGLAFLVLLSACGGGAASSPPPASSAPAASAAKPAASAAASAAAKPETSAKPAASGATAVRKDGPSFTFKFATTAPETDLASEGLKYWANLVDQRTGGRIKFQFFWAGSLLTATNMFQGVRDGLADFASPAMSYVSGQVPDVASFEVPFSYPIDADHMLPFYREVEPVINDVFASSYNQRVVWANPGTTADPVSCKNKFLDSPRAWQGALVRTAGKWQGKTTEAWGAKAVTIDLSEAYAAIQRGTADCLLLVYNLLDSFKMYEVAKNLTRIDHSVNLQAATVSLATWNKIPADDQKIMIDAGQEAQTYIFKNRSELVTKDIEKFKQQGMKVCTPSQQELTRLRSATEPVLAEIGQLQTDKGRQILAISKKYRDQVTKLGPTEGDMTPC